MSYPLTAGKGTVEPTDAGRARKTPRAGQRVRGAEDILVGRTPPPHRSVGLSLEASTEAGTGELCHGNAGLTRPLGKKKRGSKES